MADFRRVVTALAVVVLLMGFAQTVSAQPFQCTATAAVPPTLRSEGITELAGDIVLTCSGNPSAAQQTSRFANVQVFFNTGVTSRITASGLSESLLLIDDDVATAQQGTVIGNSISFLGVEVIPAGTTRNFRITNVRVNASAVASGVAGLPGTVQALISISGPTSLPLLNPQLTVGLVSAGLQFDLLGTSVTSGPASAAGRSLQQCISVLNTQVQGFLRFRELFATAFKTRVAPGGQDTPGVIYNTESGLVTGVAGVGLADFGTRLRATFANVPAGVTIWVSVNNVTSPNVPATANTVAHLISADGTAITGNSAGLASLTNVGGTATAIWEIDTTNPFLIEDFLFSVSIATTANAATNTPAAGVQGTVAGSFFPTSTVITASATAPIPRFVDTGVARNFVIFNICRTVLLFPFVTNQAGFDTGLAISNTSQDTFGTPAQAGTCTWNFFGANAPAAVPTPSVAAGSTITTLASTTAPNFQGYAIAVCNFQYAHGFAFVSDLGARNLAMGYLSLVIPDRTRVASPSAGAEANTGESLSQ